MKLFTTLLFVISICAFSIGQELVSNVISDGDLNTYKLISYDDGSYIVSYDDLDSIKVYEVSGDSHELIFSVYELGSKDQYWKSHLGSWLLIEGHEKSIAHNFISGEKRVFDSPEGYSYNRWKTFGTYAILRQGLPDFSDSQYMLIDLDMDIIDTDDWYKDVLQSNEDYCVLQKYEDGQRVIYRGDISTKEEVEIARYDESSYFRYDSKSIISFIDGQLSLTNISDGESEIIYEIDFEPSQIELKNAYNYFILEVSNNNTQNYGTIIYSKKHKKTIKWNQSLDEILDESPPDYFVFSDNFSSDSITIYNVDLDTQYKAPANTARGALIISDHQFITNVWFDHYLYDLETQQQHLLTGEQPYHGSRNSEVLTLDEKVYINLESISESYVDLFKIDLTTNSYESNDLPTTNSGLDNRTSMNVLGDNIILANDDYIYSVEGDSMVQLNNLPIIESSYVSYQISNGTLFWAEDHDEIVHFYTYLDGVKSVEASMMPGSSPITPDNFRIRNYRNGDKTIFLNGLQSFEDKNLLLDKESGSITELSNISVNLLGSFSYVNGYFYVTDQFLYGIDEEGNTDIVDINVNPFLYNISVVHEGKYYVAGSDGMYYVDGLQPVKILDKNNPSAHGGFGYIADYLSYFDGDTRYIYRNEEWSEIITQEEVYYEPLSDKYLLATSSTGINTIINQIYDLDSHTHIDLPDEINTKRPISMFNYFGENYIVSYEGFIPSLSVFIHKIDDEFTTAEKIIEFESVGRGLQAEFVEFENEGFLYIGNQLYLMDEELNFVKLEGVTGDTENVGIIEKDGYFYFIGFHDTSGRQLWRVQAFSERVSVDEINNLILSVYPNPSSETIQISDPNIKNNIPYKIADPSGSTIQSGSLNDSDGIDISQLKSGLYYLSLRVNDKSNKAIPFIKI